MRRALRLLVVAALAVPTAACGSGGQSARPEPTAALLPASDLPGGRWSLVGTTDRRPQAGSPDNPLEDAKGASAQCRSAFQSLGSASSGPTPQDASEAFARAIYRPSGSTPNGTENDLTLTIESSATARRTMDAIGDVTKACTDTMTTSAGAQKVKVTVAKTTYSTPGAVGYTITYDTDGLRQSFDMAALVAGSQGVTVSTTGSSAANDRSLLDAVLSKVAARLGAPTAPATPTSSQHPSSTTGSSATSGPSTGSRTPSSSGSSRDRTDAERSTPRSTDRSTDRSTERSTDADSTSTDSPTSTSRD